MKMKIAYALCAVSLLGLNPLSAIGAATTPEKPLAGDEVLINIPNAGGNTPFKITCTEEGNPEQWILNLLWGDRDAIEYDLSESKKKDREGALGKLPLQKQILESKEAEAAALRAMDLSLQKQKEELEDAYATIRSSVGDLEQRLGENPSLLAKVFFVIQAAELKSRQADLLKKIDGIKMDQQAAYMPLYEADDWVLKNKEDIAQAFKSPATASLELALSANTALEIKAEDFCYVKKYGKLPPEPERQLGNNHGIPLLPIKADPPRPKRGDPATRAIIHNLEAAYQATPDLRADSAQPPSMKGNLLIRNAVNPCFAPPAPEN